MDSQVDFFHHSTSSVDVLNEINTTTPFFDENSKLRQENQRLLEQLRQQIHDIRREKESVRLRLIAVESDYDNQLKELQMEIMNLRDEIQHKKRRSIQTSLEYEKAVQTLQEQNAKTTAHLKEIQQHLHTARDAIQSHVHQIECLRAEIDQLKEDKLTLEQKLQAITDERDCLLTTLSDAQQANSLLQQENANQQLLITHQENELEQLQKTAAILKDQLQTLDSAVSPARKAGASGDFVGQSLDPHQTLMGELSAINHDSEEDQWWYKHVQLDPSMTEFYEDDGIEIDDASFLATMATSGRLIENGDNSGGLRMDVDSSDLNVDSPSEGEFLRSFRTEITEIYQQLRQMCLDVSAQSTNNNLAPHNRPGDWTPDQLARIEWDFRLSSLRNVLTDLRGLLQDLVAVPTKRKRLCTSGSYVYAKASLCTSEYPSLP